jgi:hypothetical protein
MLDAALSGPTTLQPPQPTSPIAAIPLSLRPAAVLSTQPFMQGRSSNTRFGGVRGGGGYAANSTSLFANPAYRIHQPYTHHGMQGQYRRNGSNNVSRFNGGQLNRSGGAGGGRVALGHTAGIPFRFAPPSTAMADTQMQSTFSADRSVMSMGVGGTGRSVSQMQLPDEEQLRADFNSRFLREQIRRERVADEEKEKVQNSMTIRSTHTLYSYTQLIHSTHTLYSYTLLIHSTHTLYSYTLLIHSTHTLNSYTLLIHRTRTTVLLLG